MPSHELVLNQIGNKIGSNFCVNRFCEALNSNEFPRAERNLKQYTVENKKKITSNFAPS